MGATFKEDVTDIRNSKVIDIIKELESFQVAVDLVDPHASSEEMEHEYGVALQANPTNDYDAVIVAVNHRDYATLTESDFRAMMNDDLGVFGDVKGIYKGKIKNLDYWSL